MARKTKDEIWDDRFEAYKKMVENSWRRQDGYYTLGRLVIARSGRTWELRYHDAGDPYVIEFRTLQAAKDKGAELHGTFVGDG